MPSIPLNLVPLLISLSIINHLPPSQPFVYSSPPSLLPRSKTTSLNSLSTTKTLIVLGDLHLEDDMSPFHSARDHLLAAVDVIRDGRDIDSGLDDARCKMGKDLTLDELDLLMRDKLSGSGSTETSLVSLGDLGRKDIRHEPGDAGTTLSFTLARDYLESFDVPYGVITGNHDLEGLDEFDTDEENLSAFTSTFSNAHLNSDGSPTTPYFAKSIGDNVLLVGLCTTRFRAAVHSSHEVYVDEEQMEWFEDTVKKHKGWKILVFSHAPILGCNLKMLQDVHLRNGCAYINHSGSITRARAFINVVKSNPDIKIWFSGHYHLSHDFEDSLSQIGSCMFVQCGVIGGKSTRDETRQSRIVDLKLETSEVDIYTCNHHSGGDVRLDATVDLSTGSLARCSKPPEPTSSSFRQTYTPREEDGCYSKFSGTSDSGVLDPNDVVCWWHMDCGRVLGCHDGKLLEYDSQTLAPLGIVIEDLKDKEIRVVNGGNVLVTLDKGDGSMESLEVVQPNADGSYWRRFQRNKKQRLDEKKRLEIARSYLKQSLE